MNNAEKELRWADALDRMEARAEVMMAACPTIEQVQDMATMLLFSLWETDDDPARVPWPGGSDEEEILRAIFYAEPQEA